MAKVPVILKFVAPVAALLAISGCATPFKAQVNRFQAMPVPQGETFYGKAADPRMEGSLEFSQYAGLVSQKLQAVGYQPASSPAASSLIVKFDYGVDDGKEKLRSVPGSGFGYDPFYRWGGYYGAGWSPWYPAYGRRGFIYGWNDPFMFGGGYDQVESYTVYTSNLTMNIERKDGQRVFEGSAKAMSRDDNLTELVPNLVEAIFTGFPGNSGETVKITIAPPDKRTQR
jgi:hypothetical protein